jgi:hypothetical protein
MRQELHEICQWAEEIMRGAQDPLHNQEHINRMYTYLHNGLHENDFYLQLNHLGIGGTDLDKLLTAIAAHDVYRATIPLHGSVAGYLKGFVLDGFGSDWMLKQKANDIGLDRKTRNEISHAICQHGTVHLPRRSNLAHILADFDKLDMYSLERIESIYTMMMQNLPVHPDSIDISRIFLQVSRDTDFVLPWVRDRYRKMREPALIALHELKRDYTQAYLARM